jgi:hypothetical protein
MDTPRRTNGPKSDRDGAAPALARRSETPPGFQVCSFSNAGPLIPLGAGKSAIAIDK